MVLSACAVGRMPRLAHPFVCLCTRFASRVLLRRKMPTSRFRRDEFQPGLHMLEAVGWRLEEGGKQTLVGGVRFALLGGRRANSTVPILVGNGGAKAQPGCGSLARLSRGESK